MTAILGVLLTVTFVAGTFIAIDSSARATLDAFLSQVPGDFGFFTSSGNATEVRTAVVAVPGVRDASAYQPVPVSEIGSSATPATFNISILAIDPDHRPASFRDVTVAGSLALPRGTIGLSQEVAAPLTVGLGDVVFLVYRSFNATTSQVETRSLNLTVTALLSGTETRGVISGPFFSGGIAVVHVRDVDWISAQLRVEPRALGVQGEVWIDRDRFVDPYNLEASQRNLARLQRQIDLALARFGGSSSNNLVFALQSFQQTLAVQRIGYLFLSGPVILLGLYLGAVGVDLGHAERRRELAIFKTRGATPRQVFLLLALEALVGGIVAGVLGLLAGIGMSRLLVGTVAPSFSTAPSTGLLLSADTVIATVVLGAVFMLVSSYRSARRTARLPPVEGLRYFAAGETKIEYKPTLDVILIALAVTSFAVVLWVRSGAANVFVFLLGIIFFILLPLSPIFLIIGLTRIATRSTGRVYEWASRAVRPLAKNLYHVINRNVARNPRRSSNICLIIALGVGFGLLTLTLFGSQQAWEERRLRASIGADLAATVAATNVRFGANLSAVPGVAGVSELLRLTGYVNPRYCCAGVWAVDPSTLFAVSQPEPWYFEAGGASAAAAVLGTPGQVLVTRTYVDAAFLAIGDSLVLSGSVYNETTGLYDTIERAVTVGGIVRSLPGVNPFTFSPDPAIFGSPRTLDVFVNRSRASDATYLASFAPGADWRPIKENATALGAYNVRAYPEELERLNQDPFRRAIAGFLIIEIAFAAVILTVGLALVAFAAVLERNVEFAGIVARGASGRQAAGLLVGEAISILIIGLVVGAGVGVLSSWIMTQVFLIGPPGQPEPLVPFLFVLPPSGLLFIVAAPLAMVGAVLLVAWRIAHMDVARTLRVRGG